MNKRFKTFVMIGLIALILTLTGCRAKADSENAYRLPLGDSAYLAEADFKLDRKETIKTAEDGTVTEAFDYDYQVAGETYTVSMKAKIMSDKMTGKGFKLVVGYYDEGKKFNAVTEPQLYKMENSTDNDGFATYEYFYTLTEDHENMVLKMVLGSQVDEEIYLSENSDSKKGLNKYLKNLRKAEIKINTLVISSTSESNNLLLEPTTAGNIKNVGENERLLTYYNTATVSYSVEAKTLTLTLNYKGGWWQWVIMELGAFLYWITKLVGGQYWLGILIFTLLLRTIAWPIYAKSNAYSSNMSKVQPEMERINKKYEGKTDQNSKMKQQMEIREVMKKNHVSMWGCLLPFLQMPIFFAVYQVVQRFPLTPIYDSVNYKFLWTDFSMNYGQASGHWSLAVLVGITMIGSQLLSTYMQKRVQKKHTNFYTARNKSNTNTQMLIMMGVMTLMMVVFAWNSSGIAFYWIIGNLYQIFQTFISKIQEEKREEKELRASGKVRGR